LSGVEVRYPSLRQAGVTYQSFFLSFLISESLFLEVNRLSFEPLLGFVGLRFFCTTKHL
jgi:hypothetical protein